MDLSDAVNDESSSSEDEDEPAPVIAARQLQRAVPAPAVVNNWAFVTEANDIAPDTPFTGQTGWKNGVDTQNFSIRDYISLFLPDSLFELICKWSNNRIIQDNATRILQGEDELQFKELTLAEMKSFLGLTLLAGIIRKPTVKSYWSCNTMISTPYFGMCMSRDRYIFILRFLRFSDPFSTTAEKSSRMQGFMQKFHEINSVYEPARDLCLDESLLLYKGRLHFKQFIRIKRARFGIKIFFLCDVKGYVLSASIYYGKDNAVTANGEPGCEQLSKTELIVVYLFSRRSLLDQGFRVSMDNWYCSTRLADYLLRRQTGMRGTIRENRGVPQVLKDVALQPISSAFVRKNETLMIKFCDKKNIHFITTIDKVGSVDKRRVLPGNRVINYQKPLAIQRYNEHMGGVDITDQYISYIDATRRSHAWFKKLGIHMLQRLLLNSYVAYKEEKNQKATFVDFTQEAVAHLTGIEPENKKVRRPRPIPGAQVPAAAAHEMEKIPNTENRSKVQKKCRVCARDGRRKDSRYQCKTCPDKPGLCMGCFTKYHS